ncbi:pectin acetylesterase 12-like [Iris pallida]|uniref:Pectin acetylesterase n=1 Tax=Iris pallida TaxID=29817 RepID=A0AAX6F9S9_IRIPA|nr:pectin acetylesterase 12-like [Iris pallida]KAJ6813062.1 pectin acetylesterase 12-like [Iris pallida]
MLADIFNSNRVKVCYCDGASFSDEGYNQGVAKNLPSSCTSNIDATTCFLPQNLVAKVQNPFFLLNAAYDAWQLRASLATTRVDPHGFCRQCKLNNANCNAAQIQFLQDF